MDFSLEPEIVALKKMVRDFAEKEIVPHAAGWSERGEFPTSVFRQLGELGLMGMLVPEEWGGMNAGMVTYVAVMEEIGRADQSVAAAWNAHSTIASLPLVMFGTDEQKERWLRPLAEGRNIAAFGLTEPGAGSDAAGITTRATRTEDGWVIDGAKIFISNAGTDMSLGVTVLAQTGTGADGRKQFGAFFVPKGTPGFEMGEPLKKLGWHAMDTRELYFANCFVGADHLIGDPEAGLTQFLSALDPGRISVASLGLSLSQAALELGVDYAGIRSQFGRKIGEHQAIAHKVADMATQVEAARWLVYRAAWLADEGLPYRKEAAMAKLFASEVANRVSSAGVQIHGGYGWMVESTIARFYSDAKILEIGEGTSEIQRNVIARIVLSGGAGR
ncbi:acyl-CoA dehydrogenase family protein [Nocardioides sp. cx-169]|uniref:acyl-CoA dehydrogenase family protein n=1 Tax=Nocardioides sp. cx-169 TaxID=2899080 RepID=UPI001E42CF94|nr:acyl-CoA dehydrogenase family protein [Nocardioides sp. cx-169]MCD4533650.1 acyl-CoA dehydrogenase family protein [Nocardioides sp. cx-169]